MKSTVAALALFTLHTPITVAFTPAPLARPFANDLRTNSLTRRHVLPDPSVFTDMAHNADSMQSFFTSISLSDATDAVDAVVSNAGDAVAAVSNAGDVAQVAQDPGNGWFGFLEAPIEKGLCLAHDSLVAFGVSSNSWGIAIILITMVVKLFTYPLTSQQLQSTSKMQAIQPKVKELQEKYASNQEVMNQKVSQLYQSNEINPLAGCLPSLVQIPIFIGLYRAVLTLSKDGKLNEPFLFLPNLEGPTYGADPTHTQDWLLKGWVNGVPSLGWADTAAFLAIPLILVLSQGVSMQLMQPKDGPEQPSYLKFLPLIVGYFSLGVPAGLSIYWVANNIITTALTLQIRSSMPDMSVATPAAAGGGGASVMDVQSTSFNPAPIREKPDGFGSAKLDPNDITPITPVDAEIMSKSTSDDLEDDGEGYVPNVQKKRGSNKKKKRKKKKN